MKKARPTFSKTESKVLLEMYERRNGFYSSYTLTQALNPETEPSAPEMGKAFIETRAATESLIEKGFVDGDRQRGRDGVFFNSLKLTKEGQRTAISHRNEVESFKRAMLQAAKDDEVVSREIAGNRKTRKS
jgi:hypothetical protein